jgi:hypothetical protein
MAAAFRARHAGTQASLDPKGCNFACKIPIYESDYRGRPTVKIFDCKVGKVMYYSQAEWDRKKRDEEV